jgi:pantoate kinase
VPLHISGIWIPHYASNHIETGSRGVGLTVTSYLIAEETSKCSIILNNKEVLVNQSQETCRDLGVNIGVRGNSYFNLGSGFGLSAALLISHSLIAYNTINKPLLRALQHAHILEVKYRTGLGDVIAEYMGGFVVRVKPGAPGIGVAYKLPVKSRVDLVLVELNIREFTSQMLSRMSRELLIEGEKLLERVLEIQDLKAFFESSRLFTSKLFDYSEVREILKGLRGVIDYYLKKSALVLWVEREFIDEVLSKLRARGLKAHYSTISLIGVHIVDSIKSPKKN